MDEDFVTELLFLQNRERQCGDALEYAADVIVKLRKHIEDLTDPKRIQLGREI